MNEKKWTSAICFVSYFFSFKFCRSVLYTKRNGGNRKTVSKTNFYSEKKQSTSMIHWLCFNRVLTLNMKIYFHMKNIQICVSSIEETLFFKKQQEKNVCAFAFISFVSALHAINVNEMNNMNDKFLYIFDDCYRQS